MLFLPIDIQIYDKSIRSIRLEDKFRVIILTQRRLIGFLIIVIIRAIVGRLLFLRLSGIRLDNVVDDRLFDRFRLRFITGAEKLRVTVKVADEQTLRLNGFLTDFI